MTSVLHIITGLGTGGAERMLCQIACALQARGLRQHVVSLTDRGSYAEQLEASGVRVMALNLDSAFGVAGAFRSLTRHVREVSPAVIQGWMYHGNIAAALAHRLMRGRAGRRLYWNVRASNMDEARYGRVLRWGARLSFWPDLIIVNSERGAAFHVAHGFSSTRMCVAPNGVDTERFRPDSEARAALRRELGIPADAVLAIHVARVDPMKDHATFISAMEALPNVRGLMVGSGTQQLPVPANVQAIGVRQDVQLLYAAADVVVSTSVFGEGFSNVIAEGMSAGLVPIATDVGDARRIIGDTGRIVPPRDRVALMDFIMDLAAGSPGARQARGLRARARILANFTLAQAVDTFANFYAGNVTCNVGLAGAVTDATAACATTANLSPEKGRLGE